MYLLDTNLISEQTKPRPNPAATKWLSEHPLLSAYLSALTLGEIASGIFGLPAGARRERLRAWFEHLVAHEFHGRILPVTIPVAIAWGQLRAQAKQPQQKNIDLLIAATALANDLIIVTRNERDFIHLGVRVLNPFA